jgi:hypothetical protein
MDQMTQQNAAMVEEAAASTNTLADETATLRQLISRFKLSKEGHQYRQRGLITSRWPGKAGPLSIPKAPGRLAGGFCV